MTTIEQHGDTYGSPTLYPELEAALENPLYQAFAEHPAMINLDEVPASLRDSEEFQAFVEQFGWPSASDGDDAIALPTQFASMDQFRDALTRGIDIDDETLYLNNFKVWLAMVPSTDIDFMSSMTQAYAANPALHRGWQIAPELFIPLQQAYSELAKESNFPSEAALRDESAIPVVEAAHMAYQILGRLLKKGDTRQQIEIVFGRPSSAQDITSADTALST